MATGENRAAPCRRIGSWTLGAGLVATGICFLLYYFWPGFDVLLALRLSPLLLIALGAETIYYSVSPQKAKYDFLSVFTCLFLLGACFCLCLLPAVCSAEGWQVFY